ncbi:MAG: hypothetical protein WBA63_09285 [Thermomicrobiales bacterium]
MSASPDRLPIAVRAYTPPTTPRRASRAHPWTMPGTVLVFDTETTTDPTQRLLFGVWRVYHENTLIDEGLFHGDDLGIEDRVKLRAYARTHRADTERREPLRLLSRREFLTDVFWPVAYKQRGLVVGFNLPFDLARIAVGSGTARGAFFGGGFSLVLWEYLKNGAWQENRYRPRLTVKSIDSKRSLLGLTRRRAPDAEDLIPEHATDGKADPGYVFPGHFLDLRALAFALTNASHSLASACAAFGVTHGKAVAEEHGVITDSYLDYARRDVLATSELLEKLLAEHARHPIALSPTKAYSPASIGKAYLKTMGIVPPLERWPDFPPAVLGYAMTVYYGGRAECRIRRTPVPVVYLDFLSMYPTVNALMGLWEMLTADRLDVEDATEDIRDLLDAITVDGCFDPAFWRTLPALVQIEPDQDVLPIRAKYDGSPSWQIGLNVLAAGEPRWYTLADCVASMLLTGKPPRIRTALRLVPSGIQAGLQPVKLRGEIHVDPTSDDFFRNVIELRKSLPKDLSSEEQTQLGGFLKVLASSSSYGILAEMNRQEVGSGKQERVTVHGLDAEPFETMVSGPEEPGAFCFPPLAAFIAGAARLMLALLERCVTDLGGTYAMCDTDSMAIIATERGGLVPCPGGPKTYRRKPAIRALSWAQVEAIRQRFARLNPYDPDRIPGSVLKLEDVNVDREGNQQQVWCLAISAKRYCLYTVDDLGAPTLVKWSEHGLGHLLNPTDPDSDDRDWMRQVWAGIVRERLGLRYQEPAWLDRPALSRLTVSSPELLKPFAGLNAGKAYPDQVKPFNFLLVGHVRKFGYPVGVDPSRFQLIAPYESDAARWTQLPWFDRYSGARIAVSTTEDDDGPQRARLQSLRDVIGEFQTHPEAKSADVDGMTCSRRTVGLLQRREVRETYVAHVGKEANKLEEVQAGFEQDPEVIYTEYQRPGRDEWSTVTLPLLREADLRQLAAETGISARQLRTLAKGGARPHRKNQVSIEKAITATATQRGENLSAPT